MSWEEVVSGPIILTLFLGATITSYAMGISIPNAIFFLLTTPWILLLHIVVLAMPKIWEQTGDAFTFLFIVGIITALVV